MRLPAHRLFFCPCTRFSNAEITLSTGVFQTLWISIFCLSKRWKVFKEVFHSLLKTHVDCGQTRDFRRRKLRFFLLFAEIPDRTADSSRKIRTKIQFSTFSNNFPKAFENISQNHGFSQNSRNRFRIHKNVFLSPVSPGRVFPPACRRKKHLDSASENHKIPQTAKIPSIFRKNPAFRRRLHPFLRTTEIRFQKQPTKIPNGSEAENCCQKRKTAPFRLFPHGKTAKNQNYDSETRIFHKANILYYYCC